MRRALLLWLALIAGCDSQADPADMARPDAAADALDMAPDASPDAMADAIPDAMADAITDAMAVSDARAADAMADTDPDDMPDAMADADPDAAMQTPPDAAPPDPESTAYCDCMLLTCHDLYHLLWGEDEGVARRRCFEIAGGLARSPGATEGANLHCRRHWCDAAFDLDDLELCDRAGGLEVCR